MGAGRMLMREESYGSGKAGKYETGEMMRSEVFLATDGHGNARMGDSGGRVTKARNSARLAGRKSES